MVEIETVGAKIETWSVTLYFIKSYFGIGLLNFKDLCKFKLNQTDFDNTTIRGDLTCVNNLEERIYGPIKIVRQLMKMIDDPKVLDFIINLKKKDQNLEDTIIQNEIDRDRIYQTDVTIQHHLNIIFNRSSDTRRFVFSTFFGSPSQIDVSVDELVKSGKLNNNCVELNQLKGTTRDLFYYRRTKIICDPELVQAFKAIRELN